MTHSNRDSPWGGWRSVISLALAGLPMVATAGMRLKPFGAGEFRRWIQATSAYPRLLQVGAG